MSENSPIFAGQPPLTLSPANHSYGYIIRDGFLQRLKTIPHFSSIKRFGRNKLRGPVQGEQLPYLGCYFTRERYLPDGDWNAGAPHFSNRVELGISVMIKCDDEEVAESNLDVAHWAIMNYLTRQDWWHWKVPEPWPNVEIEGIEGGDWKPNFGKGPPNTEDMWAEMAMSLIIRHRTYFLPVVTDAFERMHVTITPRWPYDPGADKPPFEAEFEIPQN